MYIGCLYLSILIYLLYLYLSIYLSCGKCRIHLDLARKHGLQFILGRSAEKNPSNWNVWPTNPPTGQMLNMNPLSKWWFLLKKPKKQYNAIGTPNGSCILFIYVYLVYMYKFLNTHFFVYKYLCNCSYIHILGCSPTQ